MDVKRGMRMLKYFKVTIGLQKTNCLSEDLLMFKPKLCLSMWFHELGPHFNFFSEYSCSS